MLREDNPPCIPTSKLFSTSLGRNVWIPVWVPVVVPCRKTVRYQHQRAAECKLMYSVSKCQRILQADGFWVPIDTTRWSRPFSSHLAAQDRAAMYSQLKINHHHPIASQPEAESGRQTTSSQGFLRLAPLAAQTPPTQPCERFPGHRHMPA